MGNKSKSLKPSLTCTLQERLHHKFPDSLCPVAVFPGACAQQALSHRAPETLPPDLPRLLRAASTLAAALPSLTPFCPCPQLPALGPRGGHGFEELPLKAALWSTGQKKVPSAVP